MKPPVEPLQYITRPVPELGYATQVERICRSGIRWIQLRLKNMTMPHMRAIALDVRRITRTYGTKLIINDFPQLAAYCGADGVHLGQQDVPPQEARRLLGNRAIIGLSAHNETELQQALEFHPDYIGMGPFRHTSTKSDLATPLGAAGLAALCARARRYDPAIPIIAVGGITVEDIPAVRAAGCDGVAVSSAFVFDGTEPLMAAKFLSQLAGLATTNEEKVYKSCNP